MVPIACHTLSTSASLRKMKGMGISVNELPKNCRTKRMDNEHLPNKQKPAVRSDLEGKVCEVDAKSKGQCILLKSRGIIIP